MPSFLTSRSIHSLVVRRPVDLLQQVIRHTQTPENVLASDLEDSTPELDLLDIDGFSPMVLNTVILALNPSGGKHLYPKIVRRASTVLASFRAKNALGELLRLLLARGLSIAFASSA